VVDEMDMVDDEPEVLIDLVSDSSRDAALSSSDEV
jgi:hypothetical protein